MRTSGSHSDASLSVIPALLLLLMIMMLVGGVDDTLRHIDGFCRKTLTTVLGWVKSF